jgi:hypothetical protein
VGLSFLAWVLLGFGGWRMGKFGLSCYILVLIDEKVVLFVCACIYKITILGFRGII